MTPAPSIAGPRPDIGYAYAALLGRRGVCERALLAAVLPEPTPAYLLVRRLGITARHFAGDDYACIWRAVEGLRHAPRQKVLERAMHNLAAAGLWEFGRAAEWWRGPAWNARGLVSFGREDVFWPTHLRILTAELSETCRRQAEMERLIRRLGQLAGVALLPAEYPATVTEERKAG